MLNFLLIFSLIISVVSGQQRQIQIGAIFHEENFESELAFRYTIQRINQGERNFQLLPIIKYVSPYDSFKTERVVCELANEGVAAIFGPNSNVTAGIVGSICNSLEIPHIMTHWQPEPQGGRIHSHRMTVNFYPHSETLARALADVIIDYTWKSYTIVYETDEGLMRLKDILQIHKPSNDPITVRQLPPGPDYRPLLKEIQRSGESHIILDVSLDKVLDILRQAETVKMLEEYQRYILTTMDTHTLDFEELKGTVSNITSIRIMDPTTDQIAGAVHDWVQGEQNRNKVYRVNPQNVKTESALFHDAVRIFAATIRQLDKSEEIIPIRNSCRHPNPWLHGLRIVNFMKIMNITESSKSEHPLITGQLAFNDAGQRIQFHLEVVELNAQGFKKIATWSSNDEEGKLHYTRSSQEVEKQIFESLKNKHFKVASRLGPPFLIQRIPLEGEYFTGNARYEGYSLDLIDEISKLLGFEYEFELTPDQAYGSYNKETKQWNGLVKQLLDRKADLALCDLTITYERRTAVDFTMPFMTLGISILYAKPEKPAEKLFAFLSPLSLEVWLYMATTYLAISMLVFFLARLAPSDWENPHPCDQNPAEKENIWVIFNTTWLMMGSIMGQGCDILPKANSTRIVTGLWWFFALIMLSSYTANLAAFLTTTRSSNPINSAEDLAKQNKIKYGAVIGGSTLGFFKNSNFSTYQRMWTVMESEKPSVFVTENKIGVERVIKGKGSYAFLMESTLIEYELHTKCDLMQIGGLLDSKSYGIAMPVNSPYRTLISGAVLRLQEEGKLQKLKNKWWKTKNIGGEACAIDDPSNDDNELGIANVGGVFLVLGFGVFSAYIISICEFLWNIKTVAVEEKIPLWDAFKAELKFVCNLRITTKPVHNRLSAKSSRRSSSQSQTESDIGTMKKFTNSLMNLNKIVRKNNK